MVLPVEQKKCRTRGKNRAKKLILRPIFENECKNRRTQNLLRPAVLAYSA